VMTMVRCKCNAVMVEEHCCIHCEHARPHKRTKRCVDGVNRCSTHPFTSCKDMTEKKSVKK